MDGEPTISYLKLGAAKTEFLCEYATGKDPKAILAVITNEKTGKPGYHEDTLTAWRKDDPDFAYAFREITDNPTWAFRKLVAPRALALMGAQDLKYMAGSDFKGFPGKARSLYWDLNEMTTQTTQKVDPVWMQAFALGFSLEVAQPPEDAITAALNVQELVDASQAAPLLPQDRKKKR